MNGAWPDEGLVEHGADAVPVAREPEGVFGCLLGRHVAHRADDLAFHELLVDHRSELGRHSEVEEHDAPRLGDEHVGRLDVAVQAAARVEGLDALDELFEREPEPLDVGRAVAELAGPARRAGGPARRSLQHAGFGGDDLRLAVQIARGLALVDRQVVVAGGEAGRRVGVLDEAFRVGAPRVEDEVLAIHQLHREKDALGLGGDELVEVDEIAVGDVGEGAEFLLEAIKGRGAEVKERLEGDLLAPLAVERLVDDAHAAFAEAPGDLVTRRALPLHCALLWLVGLWAHGHAG